MVAPQQSGRGTFFNLLRDCSGNTLAIAAASLVPLAALVGGGVDVSRAYMAKTQLQAACDAGVLAGRRAMSASGSFGDAERAKADRMFGINFDGEKLDVSNVDYTTESNDEGQVLGTATATLPTLIMKIFDMDTVDLQVDCMAELQIGNADVMFVLDTTGSMAGSKIAGLRDAVIDFHKTINAAVKDQETRIRYGFVPYSMTVNARELITSGAMPLDYFVDSTDYQTREALFNTPTFEGTTEGLGTSIETYESAISRNECFDYGGNDYPSNGSNPSNAGSPPGLVTTREYDYYSWTQTGFRGSGFFRVAIGTCKRLVSSSQTTYEAKFAFTRWRYRKRPLDVSDYKSFASIEVATDITSAVVDTAGWYDPITLARMEGDTARGVGLSTYTWSGCIEERATVDETDFDPVPSDAYDLDLDLEPEDDDTRWRPHFAGLEYFRFNYDAEETNARRNPAIDYCPAEMKLFREVELSDDPEDVPVWLNSYVTSLVARGYTYHDVGMIWGGRLMSPRGIFADNVNEGDNRAVSRHLVFMTDGIMQPNLNAYSAYGIESLDNRIGPRFSDVNEITARHNARFLAACEAVKAQGTTIWVVAFGTTITDELQECASDGRAYYSGDAEELSRTFSFIASRVADLRLGL